MPSFAAVFYAHFGGLARGVGAQRRMMTGFESFDVTARKSPRQLRGDCRERNVHLPHDPFSPLEQPTPPGSLYAESGECRIDPRAFSGAGRPRIPAMIQSARLRPSSIWKLYDLRLLFV